MKALVSISLLFAFIITTPAQIEKESFLLGQKIHIQSKILKEDRQLLIYLPPNYDQTQDLYPVLYLLDGEWHFLHTIGIVEFLSSSRVKRIPEMIVVAVVNASRSRDFSPATWPGYGYYTGGADQFIQFLLKELFPLINHRYRTDAYKILAGHSLAGTFALYAFLTQPQLFKAYIPLSPCLFWHDRFMLKKTEEFLSEHKNCEKILYICHEYTDGEAATTMQEFVAAFEKRAPSGLRWESILKEKDDHFSYVHIALYEGLEFIFSKRENQ